MGAAMVDTTVARGARDGPLAGVVVADFSRVLAGPYCTMLLADLGADVIKVESPSGDDTRQWLPPTRDGVSTYYLSVNRNKRSIALDLNKPEDLRVAHALSDRADVLIQNFKPGGLERFRLDYGAVSSRNPPIIYCSISGFGTGAGASLPGYDLLAQAMSGLMSLTGDASGPAYRAGMSVFDVITGLHSAVGILAALHYREKTGEGQHIETNLLLSALSSMANHTGGYAASGDVPYRMGNAHPSLFPYEPLPTREGDLVIVAANDGQFRRLCGAIGLPALADDERFARTVDRNKNRVALRAILVDQLATRTSLDWFEELTKAGVPCGPINTIEAGMRLAEEFDLAPIVQAGDDDPGMPVVRNPISMSATPARYTLPPPTLDADRDRVLAWLGVQSFSKEASAQSGDTTAPRFTGSALER